jgi:phosphatidylserine/phosphatidylglycerophosphate/cardiolipin synthase-like enzyme
MKLRGIAILLAAASVAGSASAAEPPRLPAHGTLQAAFTPGDDIEHLLAGVIDGAQQQVLVQAYLLTNRKIVAALIAARRRGIDVRVLVDGGQLEKIGRRVLSRLNAAGIPVWLETRYQNAHNKVLVIDAGSAEPAVVTGSFNFTWTAQHKNAENVLIVREDPALAARYAANWERHRLEASPYRK